MTIWVDVTFMQQKVCAWGGTTRVILDFILGFAGDRGVRFCYFDARHHKFIRISRAKILRIHRAFCASGKKRSRESMTKTLPWWLADLKQTVDDFRKKLVLFLKPVRFTHEDTIFFPANWHLHREEWKWLMALPEGQRPGHMIPFIYDLFYMKNPEFAGQGWCELFQEWLDHMLRDASLLLTCSKSTEKDIREYARARGLRVPEIRQVRLSDEIQIDAWDRTPEKHLPDFIESKKYVLYVSTFEIRKNHALLHRVWRMLVRNFREEEVPDLILAGTPGWLAEDIFADIQRDPLIKGKIKILENIGNRSLVRLYQNCFFTVYPSLYEGWG
ncbi:MAG: glycosyltransferase, partial [Candidatus Omnitrophica bacterium]|nr:glycosyltransferase [Candidatus Omnitrophota bacterium]